MNYDEVVKLVENSDVNKIIYALRKAPGMVKYEEGKFSYSAVFRSRYMRIADKISVYLFSSFMAILIIAFAIGVAVTTNLVASGVLLAIVVLLSLGLVAGVNELRFNKMIETLVKKHEP
jgi:hypothetical protein